MIAPHTKSNPLKLLLLTLLCVLAQPLLGATALPPESLLRWSYVSDPRWSPIDERLVYVRTDTDADEDSYRANIWLLEANGEGRALTRDAAGARFPRWSPSGDSIAFLSRRSGNSQIHLLPMRGGEARQLSFVDGEVLSFSWAPDGSRIAALVQPAGGAGKDGPFRTERLDARADGSKNYRPTKRSRLLIVELGEEQPAEPLYLTDGKYDDSHPAWSVDSQRVYFSARRFPDNDTQRQNSNVYVVPADASAAPRALSEQPGPEDNPLPSPDGRWLAVTGFEPRTPPASYRTSELRLIDLSGELPDRSLTENFDYSVGDGMAGDVNAPIGGGNRLQWSKDSLSLLFTTAMRGQVQLVRLDVASGVAAPVTSLDAGEIREFDVSASGTIAAVFSRPDLPANLVRFSEGKGSRGAWRQLTRLNLDLLEDYRTRPDYEEISLTTEDDLTIQGWLIAPPRLDKRRKYPMILYIHGGPHGMYGTNFFHEFQVLASAGYYVLIANPRGSTGYGEEFGNIIQYRYPGDDFNDLMQMVDTVIERRTIDPDRLGVAGGSGGGLLTTWIVGHTDRFKAASAHRSVTNWFSFIGTADFNQYFATHWFDDFPWRSADKYLERSPISYVDKVNTPIQLIHSDADFRTPLEQTLQYYTALRMLRKPAELVIFSGESHGLSRGGKPSNRVARIENILRWFDQHLQN